MRTYEVVAPWTKSWFAHSENLILSMLASQDEETRVCGINKLLKVRNSNDHGDTSVRTFEPPALNLNAKSITELIH